MPSKIAAGIIKLSAFEVKKKPQSEMFACSLKNAKDHYSLDSGSEFPSPSVRLLGDACS